MKKMRQIKLLMPLLVISGLFFTSCQKKKEVKKEKQVESPQKENQSTVGKAIDLGLSVKWANCNVGALIPEGVGGYYAWGETEEKDEYTDSTYKYRDSNGYIDIGSSISGTQYDVAHVKWGGSWRMPTEGEVTELVEKCTWKWTTSKGVEGLTVTGPSGYSIFLPAAGHRKNWDVDERGSCGYCWSGTQYENNGAYCLMYEDYGWYCSNGCERYEGHSVRAVTD